MVRNNPHDFACLACADSLAHMKARPSSTDFLEVLVDPSDANIDIVAVHGLNPTNKESHAKQTWTSEQSQKLWLSDADFLPNQFPHARVILFGYNSNVAFKSSTAGVREQAENLLNRLKMKRKGNSSKRPIIFICHSLGGIVVKRAMVEAKLNDVYNSIRVATYGIAFFATPHQGGNHAKLGKIVATVAKGILRTPDNTFMQALEKDSLFAEGIIEDFRHQLEDFFVLSFFETLPYKKIGLIVDKKSATLSLSGKREARINMAADHSSICKFEDPKGSDYMLVIENLQELVEGAIKAAEERDILQDLSVPLASLSLTKPFICPYLENNNFIGRESLLDEVKQKFHQNKPDQAISTSEGNQESPASQIVEQQHNIIKKISSAERIVVLWGLGGVGKSQIASAYIYRLRKQQQDISIFWVHAATPDRFRQAYLDIAQRCHIHGLTEAKVDMLQLVKDWLEDEKNGKWLMVIDNADKTDDFFKTGTDQYHGIGAPPNTATQRRLDHYIPKCTHGSILVTTRNKEAAVKFTRSGLINVDNMSETESVDLIRSILMDEDSDAEDLKKLALLLDRLPLALVQASSYIRETSSSIKKYFEIYHDSEDSALSLLHQSFETEGRDSQIPNAVATSWIISFDQIRESLPRAAEILSLIAFFDRQAIPESLIKEHDEQLFHFETALSKLLAYSLITRHIGRKQFDEHRLAHLISRVWLRGNNEEENWSSIALERIYKRFPKEDYKDWDICASYLPHARAIIEKELKKPSATYNEQLDYLMGWVDRYLIFQGSYSLAEELCRLRLDYCSKHLGSEHPNTLVSGGNLAGALGRQGHLRAAAELNQDLLVKREKMLGAEHRDTLRTAGNLAADLCDQQQYEEAEKLYRRILVSHEKELGPHHRDTLRSLSFLAIVLRKRGQHEEAEKIYRQALAGQEKVLGLEHPDTLDSMHWIGVLLSAQAQHKEAEKMCRQALAGQERVLGPEHPDTLGSMHALAVVLSHQAQYDAGEQLLQQVITRRNNVLGPVHPDTLSSVYNLAIIFGNQRQYTLAAELLQQAVVGRQKVLGLEHPKTKESMKCLAYVLEHQKWALEADGSREN